MTVAEKRQMVADKYKTILGRNNYSQPKRAYCYKKYSNGKYYSDCSSSIALSYKECGFPFKYNGSSNPNTVGMYLTEDLVDVPVVIKNGIIQNPEILRVGDMLLYAGKDTSRKYAGYVGHVEMVYKINGKTITICGHGSGTPSTKNLNTYCKSRYNSKTSTSLGHRGLIKVRRFFVDEEPGVVESTPDVEQQTPDMTGASTVDLVKIAGNTVNIRKGPGIKFGVLTKFARKNEMYEAPDINGWTTITFENVACWISSQYVGTNNECTGNTVNIRKGPGRRYDAVGVAKKGQTLDVLNTNGWVPIVVDDHVRWVSEKYAD